MGYLLLTIKHSSAKNAMLNYFNLKRMGLKGKSINNNNNRVGRGYLGHLWTKRGVQRNQLRQSMLTYKDISM